MAAAFTRIFTAGERLDGEEYSLTGALPDSSYVAMALRGLGRARAIFAILLNRKAVRDGWLVVAHGLFLRYR